MSYNPLWGVGRDPRTAIGTKGYSITQAMGLGQSVPETSNSYTLDITDTPRRIIAWVVSIKPKNANGVTTSATSPSLKIYFDDELITSYQLGSVSGDNEVWGFDDIVYLSRDVYGRSGQIKVVISGSNVGGNGYSINASITAVTIVL